MLIRPFESADEGPVIADGPSTRIGAGKESGEP
jgi:hypothetical protein